MYSSSFEAEKNRKAFTYTAIIVAVMLLLAFFITWPILQPPRPLVEDLIEINLGNNKEGFGAEQPLIKGQMGPSQEVTAKQAKAAPAPEPPAKDIQPDPIEDKDAAPVMKPEKVVPKAITIAKEPVTKPVKTVNPAPAVVMPAPKPQKPKATYNGTGNGKGNGATEGNGYTYQGNKPGGKGDAGDASGKPDSYGNSPGGGSGVTVTRGVRPLNLGTLRFEDDFAENAKVYLDVKYNSAGTYTSSSISKGTTTFNPNITGIAKRKAAGLKFPSSGDGGVSTILFNFKVQN
ncbi:hypothetical protein [Ferruginibacter sp.]|uniref:hypothetical protein n=1 Tax=Ferruginibacter sp. TaxID=1940288 RepID=UPI00374D9D67